MTIATSAELVKPLAVGEIVPNCKLVSQSGEQGLFHEILDQNPAVIIFYRGSWWRFCVLQLVGVMRISEELKALGVKIMAISPDLPEKLMEVVNERSLDFTLYSDSKAELIEDFGLAFHLDDATVSLYLNEYKIDIEKSSGQTHHNLPVPAVYLVDKNKKVAFNYVNPDYKVRLDHNVLLEEVKSILG